MRHVVSFLVVVAMLATTACAGTGASSAGKTEVAKAAPAPATSAPASPGTEHGVPPGKQALMPSRMGEPEKLLPPLSAAERDALGLADTQQVQQVQAGPRQSDVDPAEQPGEDGERPSGWVPVAKHGSLLRLLHFPENATGELEPNGAGTVGARDAHGLPLPAALDELRALVVKHSPNSTVEQPAMQSPTVGTIRAHERADKPNGTEAVALFVLNAVPQTDVYLLCQGEWQAKDDEHNAKDFAEICDDLAAHVQFKRVPDDGAKPAPDAAPAKPAPSKKKKH